MDQNRTAAKAAQHAERNPTNCIARSPLKSGGFTHSDYTRIVMSREL